MVAHLPVLEWRHFHTLFLFIDLRLTPKDADKNDTTVPHGAAFFDIVHSLLSGALSAISFPGGLRADVNVSY